MIDAAARTAAGIGPDNDNVGAEAEACLRNGSANEGGGGVGVGLYECPLRHLQVRPTRAGIMHDRHMAGFEGILVADRHSVCRIKFDEAGML